MKDSILREETYDLSGGSYLLTTWDSGRLDGRGCTVIGYRFEQKLPVEKMLFEAEDFCHSPLDADDSDESLWALLGFLTLRKGDTDSEYFQTYNEDQLAWSESSDCEELSGVVAVAQDRPNDDSGEQRWK
jgi:hypothetical protein